MAKVNDKTDVKGAAIEANEVSTFRYKSRTQAVADFLFEITSRPKAKDGFVLTDDELALARSGYGIAKGSTNLDGTHTATWAKEYDGILCHGFEFQDHSRGGRRYKCTIKVLKTRTKAYVSVRERVPF